MHRGLCQGTQSYLPPPPDRKIELWVTNFYGRYPNPGKDRKIISTIAFVGSAKIGGAAVVVDSAVLSVCLGWQIKKPVMGKREHRRFAGNIHEKHLQFGSPVEVWNGCGVWTRSFFLSCAEFSKFGAWNLANHAVEFQRFSCKLWHLEPPMHGAPPTKCWLRNPHWQQTVTKIIPVMVK